MIERLSALLLVSAMGCAGASAPAQDDVVAMAPPIAPTSRPPPEATVATVSASGANDEICAVREARVVCTKTVVEIPEPVRGLGLGGGFGCALASSGNVYCWGNNERGELGLGRFSASEPPTRVPLERPAVDLAVQGGDTCVVDDRGALWCWSTVARPPGPARVATARRVRDVADCQWFHCTVLDDGSVALLRPAAVRESGPELLAIRVPDSSGYQSTAFAHWGDLNEEAFVLCGVRRGRISCAATDAYDGDFMTDRGLDRFGAVSAFSAYQNTVCAITPDGLVECLARRGVARVPGLADVRALHVSAGHTCAQRTDGSVRCFNPLELERDGAVYDPFTPGPPRD